MSTLSKKLVIAALASTVLAGTARADVIYTFTGGPASGDSFFTPSLYIDVTDAAVASGSINATGTFRTDSWTGSSGWTLGYAYDGPVVTGSSIIPHSDGTYAGGASFDVSLTFGPNDSLADADVSINDQDLNSLTVVGGTSGIPGYNLFFNGDELQDSGCRSGSGCTGTGTWTAVSTDPAPTPAPEPASLTVIGVGLIGFVALRRQLKTQAMPSV